MLSDPTTSASLEEPGKKSSRFAIWGYFLLFLLFNLIYKPTPNIGNCSKPDATCEQ
jgi:hypothetical protein